VRQGPRTREREREREVYSEVMQFHGLEPQGIKEARQNKRERESEREQG